jgi:hypothetical protein
MYVPPLAFGFPVVRNLNPLESISIDMLSAGSAFVASAAKSLLATLNVSLAVSHIDQLLVEFVRFVITKAGGTRS